MEKRNRIWGLMAGVSLGFAVWGSAGLPSGGVSTAAGGPAAAAGESAAAKGASAAVKDVSAAAKGASAVENSVSPAAGEQQTEAASPLEPPFSLHALSAVLMDGDSGRILLAKDGDTVRPMASTTKIMTCILALENGNLEDVCTVSREAASQPEVHLGAPAGTEFVMEDLLYSLMLESHNDTAVVLAEHIGGSVEGFAAMMNQKARDIGCSDTFFITPNGLDAERTGADGSTRIHGTTAADLAAILRYCVNESPMRETFLEITRTPSRAFSDCSGKRSYSCVNHNALLTMMDGALTGKTGFTGGAGYSYVGALKDGDRTFLIALLGCGWPPHKTYKWEDARKLFQYGKEHYQYRDVFEAGSYPDVTVENGTSQGPVRISDRLPEAEQHLNLLLSEGETVTYQTELPECIEAPVEAGQVVGTRSCTLGKEVLAVWPLYAEDSVERWNYRFCVQWIFDSFLV